MPTAKNIITIDLKAVAVIESTFCRPILANIVASAAKNASRTARISHSFIFIIEFLEITKIRW